MPLPTLGTSNPSQQWFRCRVNDNDGHEFADDTVDREAFDRLTAARLTEHGEILDSGVRFGIISMLILPEGKEFLRHHHNTFSV